MKRILWFRRDLRVEDNPILSVEGEVMPIFIFDENILSKLRSDDMRVSYIFGVVSGLKEDLKKEGLDLKIFFGNPEDIFEKLEEEGFDEVVASGDYDSYARERDLRISHIIDFKYVHDVYIFRPEEVMKGNGSPYLVFTPFFNESKRHFTKEHLEEYRRGGCYLSKNSYEGISFVNNDGFETRPLRLSVLGFRHNLPENMETLKGKLDNFGDVIRNYSKRDYLDERASTNLSLELRFGLVSVRSLLRRLSALKKEGIQTEPFFRQLVFRDFYAYLLYHFPYLSERNFKNSFYGIPNQEYEKAFKEGRTGVPIVDAGIRELLQTGNMHNRVRMICASFFTKDLLLPWREGEAFFAEHLMDYDAASNILSWQWSAGTGVDPQPYFRVFNPYRQSEKFDKECEYIKRWIPELKEISPKNLHNEEFLFANEVEGYPKPIVNHKTASKKAIEMFKGGA